MLGIERLRWRKVYVCWLLLFSVWLFYGVWCIFSVEVSEWFEYVILL